MADVDERTAEDLELWFEDSVPCPGAWRQGCGEEPSWLAYRPCCGLTVMICTKCKELARRWWADRSGKLDRWVCFCCGATPCPASVYSPA